MSTHQQAHEATIRRAALPEVMFVADIALAMDLPVFQVETAAREGRFGRPFFVRGRVAVLREVFLASLVERTRGSSEAKEVLR